MIFLILLAGLFLLALPFEFVVLECARLDWRRKFAVSGYLAAPKAAFLIGLDFDSFLGPVLGLCALAQLAVSVYALRRQDVRGWRLGATAALLLLAWAAVFVGCAMFAGSGFPARRY